MVTLPLYVSILDKNRWAVADDSIQGTVNQVLLHK